MILMNMGPGDGGDALVHEAMLAVFPQYNLWEFQKFKLKYFENVLIKSHENFAAAAKCHYLLMIVLTFFY